MNSPTKPAPSRSDQPGVGRAAHDDSDDALPTPHLSGARLHESRKRRVEILGARQEAAAKPSSKSSSKKGKGSSKR